VASVECCSAVLCTNVQETAMRFDTCLYAANVFACFYRFKYTQMRSALTEIKENVLCRFAKFLFTALHRMQTRFSDEKAVRLSVKRVNCDNTKERYSKTSLSRHIPSRS